MGEREGTITAEVGNRREGRAAKEGEWDKASYCTIIAFFTVISGFDRLTSLIGHFPLYLAISVVCIRPWTEEAFPALSTVIAAIVDHFVVSTKPWLTTRNVMCFTFSANGYCRVEFCCFQKINERNVEREETRRGNSYFFVKHTHDVCLWKLTWSLMSLLM